MMEVYVDRNAQEITEISQNRKEYATPVVIRYGTVGQLTLAGASNGNDGGGGAVACGGAGVNKAPQAACP